MAARGLSRAPVAGALLSGGASRRMGFDKALLCVGGQANAARLGALLQQVAAGPVLEVGPGRSGLPAVSEDPPGQGPLVALVAGARALQERGWQGPVLVVACDLPLLNAAALGALAGWPGPASVVPVWGEDWQPLCARWSAADLVVAAGLVASGHRSMRALVQAVAPVALRPSDWPPGVDPGVLADVDTPDDLQRLGLQAPLGPG